MKSKIGSSALSLSSRMSGLILKYLKDKNVGNYISKVRTVFVLEVPFEVFQLIATYLLLFGMLRKSIFLIKIELSSDPE
jgi:hypothetical protein